MPTVEPPYEAPKLGKREADPMLPMRPPELESTGALAMFCLQGSDDGKGMKLLRFAFWPRPITLQADVVGVGVGVGVGLGVGVGVGAVVPPAQFNTALSLN